MGRGFLEKQTHSLVSTVAQGPGVVGYAGSLYFLAHFLFLLAQFLLPFFKNVEQKISYRRNKSHGIHATALYVRGTKPGGTNAYEGTLLASQAQTQTENGKAPAEIIDSLNLLGIYSLVHRILSHSEAVLSL